MNSRLTFKSRLALVRYVRFFLASLLSLGLTLLLSWITDAYGLHYLLGFVLVVVLVPLFSFGHEVLGFRWRSPLPLIVNLKAAGLMCWMSRSGVWILSAVPTSNMTLLKF